MDKIQLALLETLHLLNGGAFAGDGLLQTFDDFLTDSSLPRVERARRAS